MTQIMCNNNKKQAPFETERQSSGVKRVHHCALKDEGQKVLLHTGQNIMYSLKHKQKKNNVELGDEEF